MGIHNKMMGGLIAVTVFGVLAACTARKAEAQQAGSYLSTRARIVSEKTRFARGEVIVIETQTCLVTATWANGVQRILSMRPVQGAQVTLSEQSTRGTFTLARLVTDAGGRTRVSYRVPIDPGKDNVRVCGHTYREEPFEGTEVRIPIGR